MKEDFDGVRPEVFGNMAKAEEKAAFEASYEDAIKQLETVSKEETPLVYADLILQKVVALIGLEKKDEVWTEARDVLDYFIENNEWNKAVEACDVLYMSDQPASIAALIHGVWLSVSFPVDPELTVMMLDHMIEETPKNADGAALAAVTAQYIVGVRADEKEFKNLNFLTTNLLAQVAKNHSNVDNQEQLDFWIHKLELNDPAVFIPRLGMVLNAIVAESDWWFDRDVLRQRFPQ